MGEAWNKHIQPILDTSINDHFSFVWDPFLKEYPKLSTKKRTQLEDALLESAFEDDRNIAVKALTIIEILYSSKLSSARLFNLAANKLREYISALNIDTGVSYYYILAFSNLEVKEAIPLLESFIDELQDRRARRAIPDDDSDNKEDYRYNYKDMMWACCLSLARLIPDEKLKWLEVFWKEFPEKKNKPGVYGTGDLHLE